MLARDLWLDNIARVYCVIVATIGVFPQFFFGIQTGSNYGAYYFIVIIETKLVFDNADLLS